MSARRARSRNTSRPDGDDRFSVTLRLLRFTVSCGNDSDAESGSIGRNRATDLARWVFHLDDVGAEVGEHATGHRSGPCRGGLEHGDALQRTGQVGPRVAVELGFLHRIISRRSSATTVSCMRSHWVNRNSRCAAVVAWYVGARDAPETDADVGADPAAVDQRREVRCAFEAGVRAEHEIEMRRVFDQRAVRRRCVAATGRSMRASVASSAGADACRERVEYTRAPLRR